ncbi:GNAT family N-acetyltransferase [Niabella hirudinis]|uniref:GNAT family N-acetyltransferase n=1 Tax=Niabella hirudinis TaxID=1285929 RepID=UPI003EBF57A7
MPYSLFKEPHHFLFRKRFARSYLYIRRLRLETDLSTIHRWVNLPYAHRYWQMQGSLHDLTRYLINQTAECVTSSFIVCHGKYPIALFETYHVMQTELAAKYASEKEDYGIHLLMAPYVELRSLKDKVDKISEKVLVTILEMLFSNQSVKRVIAEPDINNIHAHRLAEKAGFEFQSVIELKDKTAKLYKITKDQFLKPTTTNS